MTGAVLAWDGQPAVRHTKSAAAVVAGYADGLTRFVPVLVFWPDR